MRILIADDSDIALALLERTLVKAGHTVDTATSGDEALEWVRKGVHRMIVSDWEMPGIDGLELCRKVREISTSYVYFILVTSHSTTADIVTGLSTGADDFIVKPFNPPELLVRIRAGERVLSLESREIAIFAMANLTESRDRETGQHLERVRRYAQLLARRLMDDPRFRDKIDDKFVRLVYETSPLHDIGKVAIPDSILRKPGKLTEDEFAVMRTHTTLGKAQLDLALEKYPDAEFLHFARDIVACHHERYDGTGYPAGLGGNDIPLCARIVAVADVYDALTSDRVYRPALPHEEATRMIVKSAGSHFDPAIVEAFIELADQFESITHALAESVSEPATGTAGDVAAGDAASNPPLELANV